MAARDAHQRTVMRLSDDCYMAVAKTCEFSRTESFGRAARGLMWGALKRIVDNKTIRKPLAIAITAVIVAPAGVILFRLLRHVDVDRVVAAAQAMPFRTILTAGIFVAAAYGTLTF